MIRSALLTGLLLFLVSACGYQLQGRSAQLPAGVRSITIELFDNQTFEPFLENSVTRAVISRFSRHGELEIVEQPARAEAVLRGRITGYRNFALSYDQNDRIVEYRSQMAVEADMLRLETGEVLWRGSVVWHEDYTVSEDKVLQEDRERAAILEISERLADELFSRMIDRF